MKALRIFLSIILSACFLSIEAVNRSFERINIDDGLSNPTVECFYRDYLGYMWFGTSNGLNKYDGYSIVKYFSVKNDSTSISHNDIRCIYEDRFHNLWIGTFNSVELYNRTQNNFIHKKLPGTIITARTFFQDSEGQLWLGTFGHGLYKYNYSKEEFEYIHFPELFASSIAAISEDKKGNLWIGTELHGIFILDRTRQKIFNFKNYVPGVGIGKDFSNYKIRAFVEDAKGNIWIGSYGTGLLVYNTNESKFVDPKNFRLSGYPNLIAGITKDEKGVLWIASDGEGLITYNPQNGLSELYRHEEANNNSLCSNAIRSLFADTQSKIWIGTFSAGLSFTDINADSYIKVIRQNKTYKQTITSNNITGISSDNLNNIWITTDGGGVFTYNYKNDSWKHINIAEYKGQKYKNALSIFRDEEGNFWIGYYLSGMIKIEPSTGGINYFYPLLPTIAGNDIRSITRDKKSKLFWCATDGDGVFSYSLHTGIKHHFINRYDNTKNTIAYNFIRAVYFDSRDILWIGTSSGLSRFDPESETFLNFSSGLNDNGIASNSINCILESKEGYLFFGTENGLSILNCPTWSEKFSAETLKTESECFSFTNYDLSHGLPDNIINSMLEDQNGNIWIGTSGGMAQFNPSSKKFKEITVENQGKPVFNRNSCFKDVSGTMFFGTTDGLVRFNPNNIKPAPNNTKIVLTDIKINFESFASEKNKDTLSINQLQKIELVNTQKVITLEFSTMEMMHPSKIRYSYKLSGFDENWNTVDASRRYATYTNLNPGKYTFQIKATNYEGVWSDQIRQLTIIVKPPFYRTWWFRVISLMLVSAFIYLYIYNRIRRIKKQNKRLEVLVKERSREIFKQQETLRQQETEKNELLLRQKELEANNLKAEKELIALKNQKLENELEDQKSEIFKRNNELAASSLQLNQKIEFLTHLKSYLKELLGKSSDEDKKHISNLVNKIEKDNSLKKEWEQFEFHFDKANNNYFKKLKELYRDLTIKDLQMCSYLRLNLSNKEIANMLNISTRGVEKSRSRLRKKMNLESDTNLAEFLIKL